MTVTDGALVACTMIFLISVAQASDTPAACAGIDEDRIRLQCYDNHFRTHPVPAREQAEPETRLTVSPVRMRRAEEESLLHQWFSITPHRPNYLLPAAHNVSADFSSYGAFGDFFNDTEIKLQMSLKTQLWPQMWRNSSLWAAYTQQSYWQLYADSEASSPFRETNHEPELIWDVPVDFKVLGFDARLASFSFNHQSNGRARPLSRSWNRLTGQLVMEKGRFALSARAWLRVDNPQIDDNPNIEDFMGRIQLGAAYKGEVHTFALGLKNNLRSDNRSGVEFNWTFPLLQHLKGYLQLYSGYGENLADMENYNNRIGLGVALTDWL